VYENQEAAKNQPYQFFSQVIYWTKTGQLPTSLAITQTIVTSSTKKQADLHVPGNYGNKRKIM
jgi:hypothetical protein